MKGIKDDFNSSAVHAHAVHAHGSNSVVSPDRHRSKKQKLPSTCKVFCRNLMGGNVFCSLPANHEGPCETITSKRKTTLLRKSIILYGKDKLKERWGLNSRPRLLIQDATPDLDNLSSRALKDTCSWLDGPLTDQKPTSLYKAVNIAYENAGFTNSNNAYVEILVDATAYPEEKYWIGSFRKGYRSKTGWIERNGGGFERFLKDY
jgi:hypothetical protein